MPKELRRIPGWKTKVIGKNNKILELKQRKGTLKLNLNFNSTESIFADLFNIVSEEENDEARMAYANLYFKLIKILK